MFVAREENTLPGIPRNIKKKKEKQLKMRIEQRVYGMLQVTARRKDTCFLPHP